MPAIRNYITKGITLCAICVAIVNSALAKPPFPYQTGNVRAFVNVNDGVVNYVDRMGPEALITDASYFDFAAGARKSLDANKSPSDWDIHVVNELEKMKSAGDVVALLHDTAPTAIIGRYHSSLFAIDRNQSLAAFALPGIGRVPFEHYVPLEKFNEIELLPVAYNHPYGMRAVDYRQPAARAKLVALIVDYAVRAKASALMTDEWSPSAQWDGSTWLDAVIAYETDLTTALHAQGVEHYPNMHFRMGGANDFDGSKSPRIPKDKLRALAENCDAMLLERACNREAKPADLLADYKVFSDAGTPCVMVGDDAQFLSIFAQLTASSSGVTNYVGYSFSDPDPDWKFLPARLGKPTGAATIKGSVVERKFERGTAWADLDKRTAGVK